MTVTIQFWGAAKIFLYKKGKKQLQINPNPSYLLTCILLNGYLKHINFLPWPHHQNFIIINIL